MKSAVIKRSIVLDGHKTSVSLENEFWDGLREIALLENITLATLVGQIDRDRDSCNLSSAIRVFVFNHVRKRLNGYGGELARKSSNPELNQPLAEC